MVGDGGVTGFTVSSPLSVGAADQSSSPLLSVDEECTRVKRAFVYFHHTWQRFSCREEVTCRGRQASPQTVPVLVP